LAERLPNVQLIMYPDASHGAQSQHAEIFLEHAKLFLNKLDEEHAQELREPAAACAPQSPCEHISIRHSKYSLLMRSWSTPLSRSRPADWQDRGGRLNRKPSRKLEVP
jgi:hypothetical protein